MRRRPGSLRYEHLRRRRLARAAVSCLSTSSSLACRSEASRLAEASCPQCQFRVSGPPRHRGRRWSGVSSRHPDAPGHPHVPSPRLACRLSLACGRVLKQGGSDCQNRLSVGAVAPVRSQRSRNAIQCSPSGRSVSGAHRGRWRRPSHARKKPFEIRLTAGRQHENRLEVLQPAVLASGHVLFA